MSSLVREATRTLKQHATVLGGSVAATWGAFAAEVATGGWIASYGIHPRTAMGLIGIVTAPFLHANLQHLLANTASLLLLGWLVLLLDEEHFWPVTLLAALGSGLCAWTLGAAGSLHIGASGVIFGYFGFLVVAGWYLRSVTAVLMSLLVIVLWGGVIFGVLPGQPGISWQSHLGGFVGGVLAARLLARRR